MVLLVSDGQTQIDSRWLIYADVLHLVSNIMGVWFFVGPVVGGVARGFGLDLSNSIALAAFVSIVGTSAVIEGRSRKIKRVIRERAARKKAVGASS